MESSKPSINCCFSCSRSNFTPSLSEFANPLAAAAPSTLPATLEIPIIAPMATPPTEEILAATPNKPPAPTTTPPRTAPPRTAPAPRTAAAAISPAVSFPSRALSTSAPPEASRPPTKVDNAGNPRRELVNPVDGNSLIESKTLLAKSKMLGVFSSTPVAIPLFSSSAIFNLYSFSVQIPFHQK